MKLAVLFLFKIDCVVSIKIGSFVLLPQKCFYSEYNTDVYAKKTKILKSGRLLTTILRTKYKLIARLFKQSLNYSSILNSFGEYRIEVFERDSWIFTAINPPSKVIFL